MLKKSTLRNPNNTELSLPHNLKALESPSRIFKLPELVKHSSLNDKQLISVLYLFPNENRFAAFKILVKHFEVNLDKLTDFDRKKLTDCLLSDPSFKNLLPFMQKNFGRSSFSHTLKNNNSTPRISTLLAINSDHEFSAKTKQNNTITSKKVNSRKSTTLSALRLSLIKEDSVLRLKFFQSFIKNKEFNQSVFKHRNLEEFKNFIEIFPPNDAIKFLNLSFIQEILQQQNDQLSKESFIDLLNYFKKPYQQDAVMKLLRPISANIDKNGIRYGLFKEKNTSKEQCNLPDLIESYNKKK